jgi:hypothetical protein
MVFQWSSSLVGFRGIVFAYEEMRHRVDVRLNQMSAMYGSIHKDEDHVSVERRLSILHRYLAL